MPAGGGNEAMLRRIAPEYTQLFLYNSDDKYLYGVFEARAPGGINLEPSAWCVQPWRGLAATPPPPAGPRTRFGAQVNVAMGHFFATALRREHFVGLLRPQGHHFRRDLSATEVRSRAARVVGRTGAWKGTDGRLHRDGGRRDNERCATARNAHALARQRSTTACPPVVVALPACPTRRRSLCCRPSCGSTRQWRPRSRRRAAEACRRGDRQGHA